MESENLTGEFSNQNVYVRGASFTVTNQSKKPLDDREVTIDSE